MKRVIFLLEERSMKVFLDEFLQRVFPSMTFMCVPHDGRNDLEKSIPRKLRAWREPGVQFVVVEDNDGRDCHALKRKLAGLCSASGRPDSLVRIVCQELEAWYLGEPSAMAEAFEKPRLQAIERKAGYRNPDSIAQPSRRLRSLVPEYQKISGARRMAKFFTGSHNRSHSFMVFNNGLQRLLANLDGRDTNAMK